MPTHPQRPAGPPQAETGSVTGDRDETAALPAADAPAPPAFGPPAGPGEAGRLGPYRVLKELGRGGMGAVYAALDTRLDRRLALKVMLPRYAADPAAKARFLREARAAAGVKHDNVVTVYEADERDGVPYIAMEYLEGYPLDEYLRRKGCPTVPQALRIAAEVAAGLAAAHKLGLVHRDIKPGNLWLEAPNGRVKVLDFGLARPVDAEVELTRTGAVVGTPAFMSPEQARGEKVDARTDLFSLGAVLYRLCTGTLPFEGKTTMAVLTALATREPRPVRELNPAVPEPLAALTQQLLAKQADARPQTADEVVRRLWAVAQEVAVPLAQPVDDSPSQQPAAPTPVADVPIQVTAPPPGANPFAGIDADVTESEPTPAAAVPRPARKTSAGKTPWVFAGAAALLIAAVAGLMIVIKTRDGSKTKEPPDGAAVPVKAKDGKAVAKVGPAEKPPLPTADTDRKAAEWVIAQAGFVQVTGAEVDIKSVADLPKSRFTLSLVNLSFTEVTDAGLAHLKDLTSLNSLWLHNTTVTDAGLAPLADLTKLTQLTLSNTRVTDAGLGHLKKLQSLTLLGLGGPAVTDAGLGSFKDRKGLTLLNVRKTQVTAKGVAEFHAAVPGCKIEHDGGVVEAVDVERKAAEYVLSVVGTVKVNGDNREIKAAGDLPPGRITLTFVDVTGIKAVSDAWLANLKDCKNLSDLRLPGTQLTDAGLDNLKDCKALATIDLSGTPVTDAGLARLKNFPVLAGLLLYYTSVTDAGLVHLKDVPALTSLWVVNTAVSDKGLAALKECRALTYLDVRNTKVTPQGLADFHAAAPRCRIDHDGGVIKAVDVERKATEYVLSFGGVVRLEGQERDIKLPAELPKQRFAVRGIWLANAAVTDVGFVHFAGCKDVWLLDLPCPAVTDAALVHFKDCKDLGHLNLHGTKVTDAGLANFKDCKDIGHLQLDGTAVTDAGLAYFKDCKGLGYLNVAKAQVTANGRAAFHAAVPGCKIDYDGGTIAPTK
jgi:serine/threonine protein kinase